MKCLVTKLQGVIEDNTLKQLGEMRMQINAKSGGTSFKITRYENVGGVLKVYVVGGARLISQDNANYVSEIVFPDSTARQDINVYLAKGEYEIGILHKSNISELNSSNASAIKIDSGELALLRGLNLYNLAEIGGCDISDIREWNKNANIKFAGTNYKGNLDGISTLGECMNLLFIYSSIADNVSKLANLNIKYLFNLNYSVGLTGDILSALSNSKSLVYLLMSDGGDITGDLTSIKDLTKLQEITMVNCKKVVGNISAFGSMLALNRLYIVATGVTGSFEQLVQAYRSNGKTSGSITIANAHLWDTITYEGLAVAEWQRTNLPNKTELTLSWTASSISLA